MTPAEQVRALLSLLGAQGEKSRGVRACGFALHRILPGVIPPPRSFDAAVAMVEALRKADVLRPDEARSVESGLA